MLFEKNLSKLLSVDPGLAAKIFTISENKNYEVFIDEHDHANINIFDLKREKPIFQTIPMQETMNKIESMKIFNRYPFLYFYGAGNGIFYKLLLENRIHQKIIITEPDLELIYIALNLVDFSKEIEENRIQFIHSSSFDFNQAEKIVENNNAKAYLKLYELNILNDYYAEVFKDDVIKVNQIFIKAISHVITGIGNDATDSVMGIKHHLMNLPKMLSSYTLESLAKNAKFRDTAIIVSTGPSLSKQLPLLKEIEPYVTILCIDASLPILQKYHIKPDIVFSLERLELTAKFYENIDKEFLKDTIFAPTSIVHPKLLEHLKGCQTAVNMRPFGYTKVFGFDKWGYIGIGMSAANMAFDFAYVAKFKNIVFIGQDLAYGKDGNSHSKGHTLGEDEVKHKESDLYLEAYGGEGKVKSTRVWKLFMNFFERDIKIAVEKGRNMINSTEGGARIAGTKEIPFKEVANQLKKVNKDKIKLKKLSYDEQKASLQKAEDKILEIIAYGKEKQKIVEEIFLKVAAVTDELEKLNKEKDLEKIDFDRLAKIIQEIDKVKDIFEEEQFAEIFHNVVLTYIVHYELEFAKIMVRESDSEMDKKIKMIDWVYAHKPWLFYLAGGIDTVLHVMQEAYQTWGKKNVKKLEAIS